MHPKILTGEKKILRLLSKICFQKKKKWCQWNVPNGEAARRGIGEDDSGKR